MDDIAITGLGVVTSLGLDVATFTRRLDAGEVAIEQAPWSCPSEGRFAWLSPVHGFDPATWMTAQVADGTDLFAQYALAAAAQAVADRGGELDELRTGVVLGVSTAGARALLDAQHLADTQGPAAVPKKLNIQAWANMAAAQLAMRWKLHGPLMTVCSACASSLDAIGNAARLIALDEADVVITGGTEHGIHETLYLSQLAYGMSGHVADAQLASIPFDTRRSGIVEGAGAGIIVLERGEHARARGAQIYGYVRGYGSLADAHHPSSPDPSGTWEAEAMRRAQRSAGLTARDVDAVVAHGTSTPVGDAVEIRAINDVFDRRGDLLVTSIKGHIGHNGAAAGVLGLVAGLHGMRTGTLVHTANTAHVEPDAAFTVVRGAPATVDLRVLQVNGFGFGGQNASIVVTSG